MSEFRMRPSRVLAKLRAGEVAVSLKLNLSCPRAAEVAAMCGPDCIWLDMEHVPSNPSNIENQIRAAKIYDVDTVVRVPRGSYSDLIYPFEMDAAGVMVPHVMSAEDARKVAYSMRFHPVGRRPIDGGMIDGAFCQIPPVEYVAQANRERFIIAQIEDPEPMNELEEIARVEGIDILLFGPGDYSHGLGILGQWEHPKIGEARKRIAEVAREYGKFAGTIAPVEKFAELVDMGYQFINVASDVTTLASQFRDVMAKVR